MTYLIGIVVSYLMGSLPFGLVVTRLVKHTDLRQVGSGNIGAANVMRVGGLRAAGLVWLLDMAKAMAAVWLGYKLGGAVFAAWCGAAAVVGHCFPVWLRFHGGKGVSCVFGVLLALNPIMFVICGLEWLIVALSFGYSSLASMLVLVLSPILGFAISTGVGVAMLLICAVGIFRHIENIGRLIGGTESKLVWKWKK